ncbi:MAG: V-type ATPase subunit subunit G family protein [Gammaproteobacteria bacterium]
MPADDSQPEFGLSDAINRVLSAEQSATDAVETARDEAADLLKQARATARRIESRADARIRALHQGRESRLDQLLADIRAETEAVREAPLMSEHDADYVRRAASEMADELLGVSRGGKKAAS